MPSPDHPNAGSGRQGCTPPGDGPRSPATAGSATCTAGSRYGSPRPLSTPGPWCPERSTNGCAPTLDRVLGDSLREAGHRLDLDLGGVTFFDCGGLNVLLRARSLAERSGTA